MSVVEFFDNFYSDAAKFGIDKFCAKMDRKDIKLDKWAKGEDGLL